MDRQYLFDDDALQRFIVEGYVTLQSELPAEYHARMYDALEPLDEGGPMVHNNLLPCVPELGGMLDEPVVAGALESILGPGYYLHFHRHDHVNFPDAAQPLHKDGDNHSHAACDGLRRYHPTRNAMLFYYPQDTPLAAGPTGVVQRSQYLPRRGLERMRADYRQMSDAIRAQIEDQLGESVMRSSQARELFSERERAMRESRPELVSAMRELDRPWESAKIPLSGSAGTITIVHFDLAHGRYGKNESGRQRHMVKFLFTRNEEPREPSWNHAAPVWRGPDDDPQSPIWRYVWDWHRGAPDGETANHEPVDALRAQLESDDDAEAIAAAYGLGMHEEGLEVLVDAFSSESIDLRTVAAYGFGRAGRRAVPRLLALLAGANAEFQARIVDVIADLGPRAREAASTLCRLADATDVAVRRYAIEALGMVLRDGDLDRAAVAALSEALRDEDALVRRNAALAIARLGPRAHSPDIVDRLADNLYDWHHHVRGWSIEALQRLNDGRAMQLALRYLMSTRWDPTPKSGDRQAT